MTKSSLSSAILSLDPRSTTEAKPNNLPNSQHSAVASINHKNWTEENWKRDGWAGRREWWLHKQLIVSDFSLSGSCFMCAHEKMAFPAVRMNEEKWLSEWRQVGLNPYALKQYPKGHTALKLIEIDARCKTREMRGGLNGREWEGSGKAFVD